MIVYNLFLGRETKKCILFGFFNKRKEFNVLILFIPNWHPKTHMSYYFYLSNNIFSDSCGLMGKDADF